MGEVLGSVVSLKLVFSITMSRLYRLQVIDHPNFPSLCLAQIRGNQALEVYYHFEIAIRPFICIQEFYKKVLRETMLAWCAFLCLDEHLVHHHDCNDGVQKPKCLRWSAIMCAHKSRKCVETCHYISFMLDNCNDCFCCYENFITSPQGFMPTP